VDSDEFVRFVRSWPNMTFDQLAAEMRERWPQLSEEVLFVHSVMLGVAWSLEFQTQHTLNVVAAIQNDNALRRAVLIGLCTNFTKQASRRF
jgi:imidazoleglycerol phosphate synthase glutamine amidotransferase subunit HisH